MFCREFKDYSLMSRLHFRIHAAQTDLKQRLKTGNFDIDDDDTDPVNAATSCVDAVPEDDDDDFLDALEEHDTGGLAFKVGQVKNPEIFKKDITEDEALEILGNTHVDK